MEPTCRWCNDTGIYSGPMLMRHYAGPCLMCAPSQDEDDLEPPAEDEL